MLESDPSAQFGVRDASAAKGWRSDLFRARSGEFLDLECVAVEDPKKPGKSENYLRRGGQVLLDLLGNSTSCYSNLIIASA
jgi:hypothetical protein